MKSLTSAEVHSLRLFENGGSQLFILFQKDCSSCKKQASDLACLPRNLKVSLVGVGSREDVLREELVKMNARYPSYLANEIALKLLGFEAGATPQVALFENDKIERWVGYRPCAKIEETLKSLKGDS